MHVKHTHTCTSTCTCQNTHTHVQVHVHVKTHTHTHLHVRAFKGHTQNQVFTPITITCRTHIKPSFYTNHNLDTHSSVRGEEASTEGQSKQITGSGEHGPVKSSLVSLLDLPRCVLSHTADDHTADDHTADDHTADDHTADDRTADDHTGRLLAHSRSSTRSFG